MRSRSDLKRLSPRSIEENDWALAEKLFDKALSMEQVPSNFSYWDGYSFHLQKHQKFLKAARAFVVMKTNGKETLPSIDTLSKQKVNSVLGTFVASAEPVGKLAQSMQLILFLKGQEVHGKFSLRAYNSKGEPVPTPIPYEHEFKGTFSDGILNSEDSDGRFIIARVGKHLAVLNGNFHSFPVPNGQAENLFEQK